MQTDVVGNSRTVFLELIQEHRTAEEVIADARAVKKDVRKRLIDAGHSIKMVDRALRDAKYTSEELQQLDAEYRRDMAWLGKPLGYQEDWIGGPAPQANGEDDDAISPHQVRQVELAGLSAGREGKDRDSNPWSEDSFLHQIWDDHWLAGQQELAGNIGQAPLDEVRRGRGRPPGTRNKPKDQPAP